MHTCQEILAALRKINNLSQQDMPVLQAVQGIGITVVTYYRWRRQYGGLSFDQAQSVARLQADNARLRRKQAEWLEDRKILLAAIKQSVPTPALRRVLVEEIITELGISERRACRVLGQHRSTQRKQLKRKRARLNGDGACALPAAL